VAEKFLDKFTINKIVQLSLVKPMKLKSASYCLHFKGVILLMVNLTSRTDQNIFYAKIQLSKWEECKLNHSDTQVAIQTGSFHLGCRFFIRQAWQNFLKELVIGYQIASLKEASVLNLSLLQNILNWEAPDITLLIELSISEGSWLNHMLQLIDLEKFEPSASIYESGGVVGSQIIAKEFKKTGSIEDISDILDQLQLFIQRFRERFDEW